MTPEQIARLREPLARAVLDGWYEGNVDWNAAPDHWQHSAFLAADAILALPDLAALLAASDGVAEGWVQAAKEVDGVARAYAEAGGATNHACVLALEYAAQKLRDAQPTPPAPIPASPIAMILHCPRCHLQHIDEPDERTPEWNNPPHRSHLCHGCGCIWRPADVPTEGVRAIKTIGKADTPAPIPAAPDDEIYEIGKRDGYESAVQDIDLRTGGDGEYFASTFPGEGCPDADAMIAKIIKRFEARVPATPDEAAIRADTGLVEARQIAESMEEAFQRLSVSTVYTSQDRKRFRAAIGDVSRIQKLIATAIRANQSRPVETAGEVERLREALELIDDLENPDGDRTQKWMAGAARAALAKGSSHGG